MGNGKDGDLACPGGNAAWSNRWITGVFLLFLASLGGAATFILFRDGKGWVLLIALVAGALLWGLERLEIRYTAGGRRRWGALPGYLLPVLIISLATFAACFPTLNIYFTGDDFGYVRFFHTPSLSQFLRLLHTDIGQVVWGEPRQELRPFFSLYYMVSYQLWGLNPLGYHLSSILLHIVNSLMVFRIVKELAPGKSWRAGFAGLLFAVQPVHSFTLSLICPLVADISPTFFYLAAFLCFMRFRATGLVRYLTLSAFAFAGCLLSKEIAVTLPVMVVSYDLFRRLWGENGVPSGDGPTRKRPWRGQIGRAHV
jgi:hypothetical protein